MVELGNFIFRYRNVLFPLVFLAALIAGRPQYPMGSPELDNVVDFIGVILALLGQGVRILTIGFEYIKRGGKDKQVYANELVQGGIFAHCRNPMYVGNLLIVFGIALIIHSYVFYLVFVPFILLAYISIVAAEEKFLLGKFGQQYADYCQRVNRWLPSLRGYPQSLANMHYNWRRVLVKEYSTTFVLIAGLFGMEYWSEYSINGVSALPAEEWLIAGVLIWVMLYIGAWALKKSGYIKAK